MTAKSRRYATGGDAAALVAFVALCAAIAALGGRVTAGSVDGWFRTLAKPPFNPPDWVFGPVWTVLYLCIAVSGWLVWRRRRRGSIAPAMSTYAVQLALNLAWSLLFFGAHAIGAALADVAMLFATIVVNAALFARIDRAAGWLLVPYAAWVAFAAALNFAIWMLN